MNNAVISREALLQAAGEIVSREGFEALTIRNLASECAISVGCVYNYFPSKSDLVFALAEIFWKRAAQDSMQVDAVQRFDLFVAETYERLKQGLNAFQKDFLRQMSAFSAGDRERGRKIEAQIYAHMLRGLQRALARDTGISPRVWERGVTIEAFSRFVFQAMLNGLRNGEGGCPVLLAILRVWLYGI